MSSHLSDDLQEQYEDFRMLVRKATKESLDQPDWSVNTECVNLVKTITDPDLLYEIAQLLMRRLREVNIRIVVLTLYLIDALAHHCGHALLLTFNDEQFMQQIASVARKYHLSPSQRAISMPENHPARAEAVSVCVELLCNWSEFFRARRAYYSNIVDMAEILESEGIGKQGNERPLSPFSPSVAASQGYTTLASTSGADQSRHTQQVSPQLSLVNNNSSSNRLSDASLTTNDKSMLYNTINTTNTTNTASATMGVSNSSVHTSNTTSSGNAIAAPLSPINEHSLPHPYTNNLATKPQLTTTIPTTNTSPPKHNNTTSFKSDHPWLSREERGMQSKSDYSKTTLDSHEVRDRGDSESFSSPYSPDRAQAKHKHKTLNTSMEHKNSSHKLPITTTTSTTDATVTTAAATAAAIFSPMKTVTKTASAGSNSNNEEDFGVGGDAWDDSIEIEQTSPITTNGKGLYTTTSTNSTGAKLAADRIPHPIVIGSPQKPAQKALQEFLETNTIDDVQLQEELLNQVEIEKRIQESNRSKQSMQVNNNNNSSHMHKSHTSTHHSSTQQQTTHTTQNRQNMHTMGMVNSTPMNTPMHQNTTKNTTNNMVTDASTLQHELTHQHEIERSIREQTRNKQQNSQNHTNHNNNYNSNSYSNTNTKTHYSQTTNKVNTTRNVNSTTKSPILEDIRNFQYSFDSNEQMVYSADIMHSQSYDNTQVPPRSPHKRDQVPSLLYQPPLSSTAAAAFSSGNNNLGSGRLESDSDDNYDGNVVDYADGNNDDFFFVPSTNTYIDTIDRKRAHTGSISSNEYYTGGSTSGMSNVKSVHPVNPHNHHTPHHPHHPHNNNMVNMGSMGNNNMNTMGIGHPIMHPINPMNNTMNMYNLPTEFVSLTTTQYNFTKVPSFYSGMNMNGPAINPINSNMSTSPNYYNGGSSVHSPQPYGYSNTVHPAITNNNTTPKDVMPVLLNTQSNNSLLLDQQIEQQKLILQEFERQKQLLQLQQQNRQSPVPMQAAASPRSTYSASPLPNSPDLQNEVNLAKERLLRQQQTILASAPAVVNNNINNNTNKAAVPNVGKESSVNLVSSHGSAAAAGGVGSAIQNNKDKEKPPPFASQPTPVPSSTTNATINSNSVQQRPRGVDNLTLRTSTSNPNITLDIGNNNTNNVNNGNNNTATSVYGSTSIVSGTSNNNNGYTSSRNGGGGGYNPANRAAAGTPHSFAHTNDSLNPSLHAQRREKERHEQRKKDLETEWAREQERAMEHTTEHVRPLNHNNTTAHNAIPTTPSGNNIHTSRGRRLNITTSASISNNNDLDDITVVSDLTSSTISSTSRTLYSKIEAEPVAPPLSRSDSDIIRSMYVENHLSSGILPLQGSNSKLNTESSNNLSSTNNTNTNTSTGVNTEDPVFQSVAKMLKQALDPVGNTQSSNPHNTSMTGGGIDRAKALAAAQLLIATLTGTPAVSNNTTNTHTHESSALLATSTSVENMIDKSSSQESSRRNALSIDVSDIAIARTPRNAYKNKPSGNTNSTALSPKMEQYTTRAREVAPSHPSITITHSASLDLPLASSGSAAGMPPRSPVKPLSRPTSERYIVPDVISAEVRSEDKTSPPSKSDSASNSPIDMAVYPVTTQTRNTVALQSGISVITDDDSYFTKEPPNTQSGYNNLTSSHHHSAHERGRNRHRPPLNVGIGGINPVCDTGKPVSSKHQKGLHRSASMEPSPRHSISNTPSDFNTHSNPISNTNTVTNTTSSNSAGKLSTAIDVATSRKMHRSASLEPSRSPRHSRDSSQVLDDSVWNPPNSLKDHDVMYDRGSSNELHLSDPTSPLTEASGSPRYNTTTSHVPRDPRDKRDTSDNKDNVSTAYSHNESSRHSKQSAFDSASESQANFVANAILNRHHRTSPRGTTTTTTSSRSVERDTSKGIPSNYRSSVDNGSMQGTTSSVMESSYAQDSHRGRDVQSNSNYAASPGSVSHSHLSPYNGNFSDRDNFSRSPHRSPTRSAYEENTHSPHNKPRSTSRSRDPAYRETIYNNPFMDIEVYRASTTKEERRADRQRERERRDLEKAKSERRRDGEKNEGGAERRGDGSYVSRGNTDAREERERYEESGHFSDRNHNSNRSSGGEKYKGYDNTDYRSDRDDRSNLERSDRERTERRSVDNDKSRDDRRMEKSSSRDPRDATDYYHSGGGREGDSAYDRVQSNRTRTESNNNMHTNSSSAINYTTSSYNTGDRVGTRDRADSTMSGMYSNSGRISLVDVAKTHDPNYKPDRSPRPSSMSNRRIYEDDLNSRHNHHNNTSASISPMNHPSSAAPSVVPSVTPSSAELYPTTYAPSHHRTNSGVTNTSNTHTSNTYTSSTNISNTSHSSSRNNLVSQSYDDRHYHPQQHRHMSNSNLSVGYTSDRPSHNHNHRRSSHDLPSNRDTGNHDHHRRNRDFRDSERDYSSQQQQSYVDDAQSADRRRHSMRQMETYNNNNNHPHSSLHREMSHSPVNNYPSNNGSSSRPVSLHRSSSNKYESSSNTNRGGREESDGTAKHSLHHSSYHNNISNNNNNDDDDVTRLSRPVDPTYNNRQHDSRHGNMHDNMHDNMRSTSTHSINYPINHHGIYNNNADKSNTSTPTAVYTNTKPSSTVNVTKPSASHNNNSNSAGDGRKKWVCNMCTLENPPDFLACDACGMLRSK